MKKYIMLGMGYVSPKHLDAIKNTGGELVAYHDVHDVVGHVDSRFPWARFYNEFIHLDCFVDRYQSASSIDYCVICLPNHLHNPACRWAMRNGMDVIVEKPIVVHERNLDELLCVEYETGKRVNTILQCRLHQEAEKGKVYFEGLEKPAFVNIEYSTPRGPWYLEHSWKGDIKKSGGIATNIGVHLFDLCCWLFGKWIQFEIYHSEDDLISGSVMHDAAQVEFNLSIRSGERKRVFAINDMRIDLTSGFDDLHTKSYEQILMGNGFGIEDARPAIRLVEVIRNATY